MKLKTLAIAAAFGVCTATPLAAPIFIGGPAVITVDRQATFDSLTADGLNLAAYQENSLFITVDDLSRQGFQPFSPADSRTTGFHYGVGGNNDFVSIRATDGARFSSIDFRLGDGNPAVNTTLRWQTYLGGSLTGNGVEAGLAGGEIYGLQDLDLFDEVRLAAADSPNPGFGNPQAIAIDDLRVGGLIGVPAPAIMPLIGIIALSLFCARRFKRNH